MDKIIDSMSELEKRVTALENKIEELTKIRVPININDTFLVIDHTGKIQIVNGEPPEGYKTPIIPTEITLDGYRNNKYDSTIIQRFRFPTTNSLIFRGGYAIDPNTLEGKIIEFIINDQRQRRVQNITHEKRYWEITEMKSMTEAIAYLEKVKGNKKKSRLK